MNSNPEMFMLDKEVAEERTELAESEWEDVKEKRAILRVENNVLEEGLIELSLSLLELIL